MCILSISAVSAKNIDFDNLLKEELNYNGLLSIVICSKINEDYCISRRINIEDFEYNKDFQKYEFPEKNEKIVPIYILFKKYSNKNSLILALQFKNIVSTKEDNKISIPKVDTINLIRTIEKRKTIHEFNLKNYYGFFYLN